MLSNPTTINVHRRYDTVTKCFKSIASDADHTKLQQDFDALYKLVTPFSSKLSQCNLTKCFHVSFNSSLATSYYISNTAVTPMNTQKNLEIIVSSKSELEVALWIFIILSHKLIMFLQWSVYIQYTSLSITESSLNCILP